MVRRSAVAGQCLGGCGTHLGTLVRAVRVPRVGDDGEEGERVGRDGQKLSLVCCVSYSVLSRAKDTAYIP